jgi:hypothetical protein
MLVGQGELIVIENLIHETFSLEIPLEMKSHLPYQLHFYLFFQEKHVWIKKLFLFESNILLQECISSNGCEDLYVVLDNCYNTHGISGYQMRINLHNILNQTNKFCWLYDNFLSKDATNNMSFCQSKTLNDLQALKGFMLLDLLDSNKDTFFKMCPDVILPSVCLLYKTNIFYIDLDRKRSYFHFYDKNSSKIITYSFNDTTKSPSKNLKYNTFLKEDNYFKFITQAEVQDNTHNSSQCLLFLHHQQKHTALSKHPQGRLFRASSIAISMRELLMSTNINYEHFRDHLEQEDILDIKS